MTLAEFLRANSMTVTALALAMERPVSTVHGWVKGRRRPEWSDIPAIIEVTDGKVTAADFVPAPADPDAVAADMQRRRAQRTAPTQATVRCEVV